MPLEGKGNTFYTVLTAFEKVANFWKKPHAVGSIVLQIGEGNFANLMATSAYPVLYTNMPE